MAVSTEDDDEVDQLADEDNTNEASTQKIEGEVEEGEETENDGIDGDVPVRGPPTSSPEPEQYINEKDDDEGN